MAETIGDVMTRTEVIEEKFVEANDQPHKLMVAAGVANLHHAMNPHRAMKKSNVVKSLQLKVN